MPAIESRSVTSACAAFGVGAGQRRQHALVFRRGGRGASASRSRSWASEVLRLKSLISRRFQAGCEIERRDQRRKQPDIAHADFRRGDAVVCRRFEPEREHLCVGRGLVVPADDSMPACENSPATPSRWRKPGRDSRTRRPSRRGRGKIVAATPEW